MSDLHMYHFYFFNLCVDVFHVQFCCFHIGRSSAWNYRALSYFMNIMYNHIFLNFGIISFINKEMVSFFQLHTYKFGVAYDNDPFKNNEGARVFTILYNDFSDAQGQVGR